MSKITIKPVKAEQVALLAKVAREAYLDHYRPLWQDEGVWYISKVYTESQLLSELEDKNVAYFFVYNQESGAENKQKPIGFIKLKKDYPLSIGQAGLPFGNGEGSSVALENALYLERIYFIASATGQGLGGFCFNFIENNAHKNGNTAIWLMAMDSSTKAIRFYEKQGFEHCGTWELDFEALKQECRGMVILKKELAMSDAIT
jgi:diamine N-acetyltransferase